MAVAAPAQTLYTRAAPDGVLLGAIHPLALVVPTLGSFLVSMDVSVTNALQPAIQRDFGGAGTAAISWTITAYAITFAATLVPAGRLADRAGRRRTFVGGLLLFALASVLCGAAPGLPALLAGRVLQGAGAAAVQPSSLGLLLAVTPETRRSMFAARWAAAGAVGIALGPVIGGALTALASWRVAFLVNVPIIACAVALAVRLLPETARRPGRSLPDPVGALQLAASAALLTLAISQLATWGPGDTRTIASTLCSVGLAVAFVRRCHRVPDPLLHLDLLHDRSVALLTATTILYAAAFFGLLFSFILFLTDAWHLSTIQAGLGITPMALVVVLLSLRVGDLPARIGFAWPLAAGTAIIAAGLVVDVGIQNGSHFHASWIPVAAFIGLGIALCYLLLGAAAVAGRRAHELAAVTAINQCARQLGAALGVSSTVAALGPHHTAGVDRFHLAWLVCAAFAIAASFAASFFTPGAAPLRGGPQPGPAVNT
jgi:EmrB/QacA subfamily drug resistance transporter